MSIKPILPEPSAAYSVDRERVRNASILRLLGNKLDRDKLPQYPGTPMLIMKGSTVAFPVLTGGSWTNLPFNSGSSFNDFLGELDTGLFKVEMSKTMTLQQVIQLVHVAGVAAVDVVCEIGIFVNGALFKSLFQSIPFNKDCSIMIVDYLANLAEGDELSLAIRHDNAGTFVINMIQSNWTLTQMTPNPTYVESRL